MRTLLLLVVVSALCGILSAAPKPKPGLTLKPTKATTTTTRKPKPPVTSSCKAIWSFTTPCAEVNATLIQQVKVFSPNAGCDVCSYLFVSADNLTLTVDHSSSDGFEAETIVFHFTTSATAVGCQMFTQSQSIGPSATTDDAVNYCNIYDLLTGSGLSSLPGSECDPFQQHRSRSNTDLFVLHEDSAAGLHAPLFGLGVLTATDSSFPIPYHAFCKSI